MSNVDRKSMNMLSERIHIITVMDYLSKECTIDKMTVSSICDAAKIARSSFYRLFEDKYDAANWYLVRAFNMGNGHTGINYTWYEGNVITLSLCLIMKSLLASAWHSDGYHAMKETGIRMRHQQLIDALEAHNVELTDELQFQVDSFAYLESKLVRTWISSSPHLDVETIASYIVPCVPRTLHDALAKPIDPKPARKMSLSDLYVAGDL